MTNITLSIEETIYKKMRQHSEIKWSEFVRNEIKKQKEKLEEIKDTESVFTMLASQEVLKKEWENKFDERWDDV